jgi:NAD(P)-dependent dehydrogenase (short-subunit alcohol dehydrogenase family)
MNNVLIVGAGRGIGLQLLHHYSRESTVWATHRTTIPEMPVERRFALDLGHETAMARMVQDLELRKVSFKKVIFVAAKTPPQGTSESSAEFHSGMSPDLFEQYMRVNALGPLVFFERLYMAGLIERPSTIVFLSSLAGSIEMRGQLPHNQRGGNLAYRMSKSALNCGVRNVAYDLSNEGVTVVSLHPGWVRTRSGGPHADTDEVTAGAEIASLIDSISVADNGKFLHVDGSVIPW